MSLTVADNSDFTGATRRDGAVLSLIGVVERHVLVLLSIAAGTFGVREDVEE